MRMHTRTRWNYLMIGLTSAGLLAVGAFFLHTGTTALTAEEMTQTASTALVTNVPFDCKNKVDVDVDINPNYVSPETFTVCQDHGSHGQFAVTWKSKGTDVTSFTVEFKDVTPFVNGQGDDVFVFNSNNGGISQPPAHTKNLGLGVNDVRYFKYKITVCYDSGGTTKCDSQDPGGVFVH